MKTDWIRKRYGRVRLFIYKRWFEVSALRKFGFTYQAIARCLEVSVARIQQYEKGYLRGLSKNEIEDYRKAVISSPFKISIKQITWKIKPLTSKEVQQSILI